MTYEPEPRTEPVPTARTPIEPPRTAPLPVVRPGRLAAPAADGFSRPGEGIGGVIADPHPQHSVRGWPRLLALAVALVGAVGFVACWRLIVGTTRGQTWDESAYAGALYGRNTLWRLAEPVLDVVSVGFVVVVLGAAALIALARQRWGLVLQVAVLVGGANVTTQLLKHQLLERPELGVATENVRNTLPSGHTTVGASVSIALLLVVPRRLRPLVALLGATYTVLTGISTLVGQWHRPSDVLAALFVVLAWSGLVLALTPRSGLDRDGTHGTAGTAVATTLLVVAFAVSAALAYGVLSGALTWGAEPETRDYLSAGALVAAVTAAVFGLVLLVRQATARGAALHR